MKDFVLSVPKTAAKKTRTLENVVHVVKHTQYFCCLCQFCLYKDSLI